MEKGMKKRLTSIEIDKGVMKRQMEGVLKGFHRRRGDKTIKTE